MPSFLALVVCILGVIGLLYFEVRRTTEVSRAIWIPTLWIIYCASKPLAVWFSHDSTEGVAGGSALDRNFLTVLIAAALIVLTRRQVDWKVVRNSNRWLMAICVYAFISIAWSDFPFVSIKRYIRFIGGFVVATIILTEDSPSAGFETVLRRAVYVLVPFSLLLVKYFPSLGVAYGRISGGEMWVGVATQKNSLGVLCLVAIFFLFWSFLKGNSDGTRKASTWRIVLDTVVTFGALFLLKGPSNAAASKTSFVVAAIGCTCLLALLWLRKHNLLLAKPLFYVSAALLYFYGAAVPFGLTALFAPILQALGRDVTFTGRTEIWAELIPIAMQSPVLGCGYGGFWVLPVENGVNEAHNGYIDVLLELGILGLILVFGFVMSVCSSAIRALPTAFWYASFALSFVVMVVLHNASESTYLKTSDFLWSILVTSSMLVAKIVRGGKGGTIEAGAEDGMGIAHRRNISSLPN